MHTSYCVWPKLSDNVVFGKVKSTDELVLNSFNKFYLLFSVATCSAGTRLSLILSWGLQIDTFDRQSMISDIVFERLRLPRLKKNLYRSQLDIF